MDVEYHQRTETTVRHQLVAKTPVDAKNMYFLISRVERLIGDRAGLDDSFIITTEDDHIVFSWTATETMRATRLDDS